MNKKVALIGSSSVGKSTVFHLLKETLPEFTFISESTRTVKSFGFPINEEGNDLTQLAISSYHLSAILTQENVILDRCYLDLLVYSTVLYEAGQISKPTWDYIEYTFENTMQEYTHFIYFPIEFTAVEDGVRSVNEEWREKVDKTFKKYLELYKIEYLTVTGSPKQRAHQILNYINEE